MSLWRELAEWMDERRAEAKRKLLMKAERDLAEEKARLAELVRNDARCSTFKFADDITGTKGRIARLEKLIEQHK